MKKATFLQQLAWEISMFSIFDKQRLNNLGLVWDLFKIYAYGALFSTAVFFSNPLFDKHLNIGQKLERTIAIQSEYSVLGTGWFCLDNSKNGINKMTEEEYLRLVYSKRENSIVFKVISDVLNPYPNRGREEDNNFNYNK